jgi:porphobilinogen synthase
MRRLRRAAWSRALVAETHVTPADLIWPIFVRDGKDSAEPIATMPGVFRHTVDRLPALAKEAEALGIPAIAIFPYTQPERRSEDGAEALNPDNLVCRALKAIRDSGAAVGLMTDIALDPYTSHGHDGVLNAKGQVANDETVALLCRQALCLAEAGCDIVAPSDMMDGRIGAIRQGLEGAGHTDTLILSYAAKYASAFYGPFRQAVGSAKATPLDKRGYQMDPANRDEALREVALDLDQGADMVMVKPALLYLDVISRVKAEFAAPTFAYHVSGEYAMVKAAAAAGMLDERSAMIETLLAIKRAGADAILTYAARDVAMWVAEV